MILDTVVTRHVWLNQRGGLSETGPYIFAGAMLVAMPLEPPRWCVGALRLAVYGHEHR